VIGKWTGSIAVELLRFELRRADHNLSVRAAHTGKSWRLQSGITLSLDSLKMRQRSADDGPNAADYIARWKDSRHSTPRGIECAVLAIKGSTNRRTRRYQLGTTPIAWMKLWRSSKDNQTDRPFRTQEITAGQGRLGAKC
jgi:hypothetical protein